MATPAEQRREEWRLSHHQRHPNSAETRRAHASLARWRCVSAYSRGITTLFFLLPLVPAGVELTCNQFQAVQDSWKCSQP